MPHANPCRHLHTSGRPCGSPALRGEPFCFYHHTARKPMPKRDRGPFAGPQLPAPDDFLAIQRGLGEVLRLLALDQLTDRRAQTLLNGLAKASTNLARHHRHEEKLAAQAAAAGTPLPDPVTEFVNDEDHGTLALTPNEIADSEAAAQPIPDPIPLLTPLPGHATSYEEATLHQMYGQFSDRARFERLAFESAKRDELEAFYEAKYQAKYQALHAALEARFQRHSAQTQTTHYLQLHPTRLTPRQTPAQQNQDFRIKPQKLLNAPIQLAG